jgi:hypothetical protein
MGLKNKHPPGVLREPPGGFSLRLYRIPGIDPRLKPTFDRRHVFEAIGQKNLRRTGAAFFVRSGAIGDDPLVLVECIYAAFQID